MALFNKKLVKNIFSIFFFIIFCYIIIVLNLYKSTSKLEFNILKSIALGEFLLFIIIVLPLSFIIKFIIKRFLFSNRKGN
jgi:hypothetical protein